MSAKPESNERPRSLARSRQLWVPVALLSVVALAMTALWFFRPPPLGDCFGGLLNQDPLHCYALEQTQKKGLINIEKIYDADGVLYLSLRQEGPVDHEVYEFLKTRSFEFYDRWPDNVPRNPFYDRCTSRGHTYRECYLDERRWRARAMLPRSLVYENLLFHVGGETARRLEPGWAGWRQVWPRGVGGVDDGTPSTFDVSDVDMTMDTTGLYCPEKVLREHVFLANTCSRDRDIAHSIVGNRSNHIQYKNPPTDEAGLHAIKKAIDPCYDVVGDCFWHATTTATLLVDGVETEVTERVEVQSASRDARYDMVIIPVKYSYAELAHWAQILDRFGMSRSNTIGIMGAEVDFNRNSGYSGPVVWPLDDLGPPGRLESGNRDWSAVRETIQVWGGDAQRIADALPVLLPLLGIPVDAVGVVTTSWRGGLSYTW